MTFIFDDVTNPALLRRERRNRRILIGAVLSLLVGSLLTYWLWNWRQEAVAKRFLAALEQQDYREAYKLWEALFLVPLPGFYARLGAGGGIRESRALRDYWLTVPRLRRHRQRSRQRPGNPDLGGEERQEHGLPALLTTSDELWVVS